jgi:hypothetical protein
MNRRLKLLVLMSLTLLIAVNAKASELQVHAPVVNVEPLREAPQEIERCPDRPLSDAGLAEILVWDLGLNCTTELIHSATVNGYRVSYRWDDRVYSQVMSTPPGNTVPLKVRLD